jgi:hypothetical protein
MITNPNSLYCNGTGIRKIMVVLLVVAGTIAISGVNIHALQICFIIIL